MLGKDLMVFVLFLQVLIEPLMKLSLKLQTSNITLAESMLWIKSTADLISDLKPRENEKISEVLESGIFKGVTLKGRTPSAQYIENILTGAVTAIQQRFNLNDEDTNLVKCTEILNLKSWPIEDASFGEFGNKEIQFVADHFKTRLTIANDEFSVNNTVLEWQLMKKLLVNRYGVKLCAMDWCDCFGGLDDDFIDVINVIDFLLTLPPTSVSCKTSFSHMKLIKTTRRSSMHAATLNSLLTVKLTSPDIQGFKAEEAVEYWLAAAMKPKGQRRINYNRVSASQKETVLVQPNANTSDINVGEDINLVEQEDDNHNDDDEADITNEDSNDEISIINFVYGEDDGDDDFCLDFQDEMMNNGKIEEYANEE